MDVHIGEMNSTVRAMDTEALLNPQVLDQITLAVMARVHDAEGREERADDERELRQNVSGSDYVA